jgi:cation transport ATPase
MDFERRMSTVKKTYRIEVDCANCANLMEEAANRTEGVQKAVVNFMTQRMTVEFAEGSDEKAVMKEVVRACKRVEEDCEIYL